jgi:hypothetical protein
MRYIRDYYGVPAKRGARIEVDNDLAKFITGFLYKRRRGTVVASRGGYIRVRFDADPRTIRTLHPTWKVRYL